MRSSVVGVLSSGQMPSGAQAGADHPASMARFVGREVMTGLVVTPGIEGLLEAERGNARRGEGPWPPDPFAPGQVGSFITWLQETPGHSVSGLPRYMQAIYDERADLREMMPEVEYGELRAFEWWAHQHGRREEPTLRYFGHRVRPRRRIAPDGRRNRGVDVIGFFTAEHGVGEAARLMVNALSAAKVPVSTLSYRNTQSRQRSRFATDEEGRYRTTIVAVNAELNEPLRREFGDFFFKDTYVIGQWFWEMEAAPPWYGPAYKYVDELWAPTRFIETMLRRDAPRGVHIEYMPLPLRKPSIVDTIPRSDLGLDDRFMFLFVFDFMSVAKRKNPVGLVEAFKLAFADGDGPQLVIKSINGHLRPNELATLEASTSGRSDITVIDRYLDAEEAAGLMNMCDCYASLHRSEGLGLTIAEAMLLGKPVIATGYSGNMDFMSEETSFLVPWTRVNVGSGAEGYDPGASWAEPDPQVAAGMMRQVYAEPEKARAMAAAGRADVETRFAVGPTGGRMLARLEAVWETLR